MSETFQVISPVDNRVCAVRSFASPSEVEMAIQNARKVAYSWEQTNILERMEYCRKAVSIMVDQAEEIGEEISLQMGRPVRYSSSEIKGGFQERALHMLDLAENNLKSIRLPAKSGFKRFINKEPLGTILVLAPWNYPYLTAVNSIIPALVAGNRVILKHAKQTPLCAERLVLAFQEAGLPEGVFQYLHLTHDQVGALVGMDGIDHVVFTGSVDGGRAVLNAMGGRFIGSSFELGGKDPAYVCEDADLDLTVENLVDGSFFNSGQSCCGIERIYVKNEIFRDFVDAFCARTDQYILGDPMNLETTLGPLVKKTASDYVRSEIEAAVARGARQLIDPKRFHRDDAGTPYMAPKVLIDVDHSMSLMTSESFGPVVGIMPVVDDAEALQLMNDSVYGLTASIWTSDQSRAILLGEQIETGTVYMNRCDYLDPSLAWTGVKDSGRGVALSELGYDSLTRPKSFHLKL